jgi:hypothetical protein
VGLDQAKEQVMGIPANKVRLQTVVDKPLAEKIRELAGRMGVSESAMCYLLLEAVVSNDEWLIRIATSSWARKLGRALGIAGTDLARFLEQNDQPHVDDVETRRSA